MKNSITRKLFREGDVLSFDCQIAEVFMCCAMVPCSTVIDLAQPRQQEGEWPGRMAKSTIKTSLPF